MGGFAVLHQRCKSGDIVETFQGIQELIVDLTFPVFEQFEEIVHLEMWDLDRQFLDRFLEIPLTRKK